MTTYITDDFEPTADTYKALQANGIPREFLDLRVTEHFNEFWRDLRDRELKKGKKSSWQTTYRVWARRAFEGKAGRDYEKFRHVRHDDGKMTGDLFKQTLERLAQENPDSPNVVGMVKSEPPPPIDNEVRNELQSLAKALEILGVR